MKRFAILTISLILALAASGTAAAFAEEGETVYPKDEEFIKPLTFEDLRDYSLNSESYAFADGETVIVFDGGTITEYGFGENVTALDCSDDIFYCSLLSGKVYSIPYEEGQECAEHAMPEPVGTIDVGDYNYRLTSSALKIADYSDDSIRTFAGEYKNLKKFGDCVYATLGNEVYKFTGAESEKLSLSYADYASTRKIYAGEAVTALKEYAAPTQVTVKDGAHMTETDLTDFREGCFVTGRTVTNEGTTSAFLLCTTGNAALIAIGPYCYILNNENVTLTDGSCYSAPEFEYAKITAAGDKIYASPYVSECTAITSGAAGLTVKVLNKVQSGVLDAVFYEIEFPVAEGVTAKGYITENFLIKTDYVKEDDNEPETIEDPEYTEESNTKTILIILAAAILVLAAVGYLAFAATGDKRKKGKSKKNKAEKEE